MKYLIILAFFFSFSLNAQRKPIYNYLLDGWVFSKDTSVQVPSYYDYAWILGLECDTLTGSYNGTLGIKGKLNGMDRWVYLGTDTTSAGGFKPAISSANYANAWRLGTTAMDSLKFELTKNSITGGTVKLILKRY